MKKLKKKGKGDDLKSLNFKYHKDVFNKKSLVQKRYYSKKVKSKSKITQFKDGVILLNKAVNAYEEKYLADYVKSSWLFLLMGYFSFYVSASISIMPLSFIYLIAAIEFIISFALTVFVTYKKICFIRKYPLDCNPKGVVTGAIGILLLAKPVFKYTAAFGGTIMATNYFLQDFRGVNVIAEVGQNYIDGDKSARETTTIVWDKLKKGYKDID